MTEDFATNPTDVMQCQLKLYIAGQSPKSVRAIANLKKLCEQHRVCIFEIEVIDLLEHPELAKEDEIFAVPTLVRKLPEPIRKIIGDLSDMERTLVGLQIRLTTKNEISP